MLAADLPGFGGSEARGSYDALGRRGDDWPRSCSRRSTVRSTSSVTAGERRSPSRWRRPGPSWSAGSSSSAAAGRRGLRPDRRSRRPGSSAPGCWPSAPARRATRLRSAARTWPPTRPDRPPAPGAQPGASGAPRTAPACARATGRRSSRRSGRCVDPATVDMITLPGVGCGPASRRSCGSSLLCCASSCSPPDAPPRVRRTARLPWPGRSALVLAVGYLFWVPPVPDLAAQTARADTAGAVDLLDRLVRRRPHARLQRAGAAADARVLGVARRGGRDRHRARCSSPGCCAGRCARRWRPSRSRCCSSPTCWPDGSRSPSGSRSRSASLRLLAAGRTWWAALPAALSGLASPVAALFLGVVAAVLVLFAPGWRRRAFVLGVAATVPVLAVAVLFPDPGRMPVHPRRAQAVAATPRSA